MSCEILEAAVVCSLSLSSLLSSLALLFCSTKKDNNNISEGRV